MAGHTAPRPGPAFHSSRSAMLSSQPLGGPDGDPVPHARTYVQGYGQYHGSRYPYPRWYRYNLTG